MNTVTLEIEIVEDISLFDKLDDCFTLDIPFNLQRKLYRVSGKKITFGRYGKDCAFSLREVIVPKTEEEIAMVLEKWKGKV